MNLILRLIIMLAVAPFRSRLSIGDVSRLTQFVLPNDLDLNLHMNNGRYLTVMDLGRLEFIIRARLVGVLLRNRWQPLIGGTLIRYRFALRPFQKFVIVSRVLWWDDKWFYFEQRMESAHGVAAIALAKGLFRSSTGTVSPEEVLRAGGMKERQPSLPDSIARWLEVEETLHLGEKNL
jgi:acyl-CoA thioesterase FadM